MNEMVMRETLLTTVRPKDFEKVINRLNRKAARLGVEPIRYEAMGSSMKKRSKTLVVHQGGDKDVVNVPEEVKVWEYNVTHLDIVQDGWKMKARIGEPMPNSERNFVEPFVPVADLDVAKWEHVNHCNCDHCGVNRNRKGTWVVEKDGQEKQVGSACLKEVIGGDTAATIAFASEIYVTIREFGDEENWGRERGHGSDAIYHTKSILARACSFIKEGDWQDNVREYGELIKDGTHRVISEKFQQWFPGGMTEAEFCEFSDARYQNREHEPRKEMFTSGELLAMAEEVVELLQETPATSEFHENLLYLLSYEFVPANRISTVAYAPKAAQRILMDVERERSLESSEFVGSTGERIPMRVESMGTHTFNSDWGIGYINVLRDEQGNMMVWKTSSENLQQGNVYDVTATIKQHERRLDRKSGKSYAQTQLSRVKINAEAQRWEDLPVKQEKPKRKRKAKPKAEHAVLTVQQKDVDASTLTPEQIANVEVVIGNLTVGAMENTSFPRLRNVSGDLDVVDSKAVSMPNLESVGKCLYATLARDFQAPKLQKAQDMDACDAQNLVISMDFAMSKCVKVECLADCVLNDAVNRSEAEASMVLNAKQTTRGNR